MRPVPPRAPTPSDTPARRPVDAVAAAGLAALLAISAPLAGPAAAQSLLDKLEAQIDERADDLARADALLNDPSPERRIAAMEALLESGDPEFVHRAKTVGLTSDDPRLRTAALKAVLDGGGTYHAEFDIPKNESGLTPIFDWLRHANGTWSEDRRTGFLPVSIGAYIDDKQCWEWLNGRRRCVFRVAGETVLTGDWNANLKADATLKLDETGALTGAFLVDAKGRPVTMRIPLVQ